jgi:peptidoglycan/xylan/chitin deacetylase (PgdA/CDA1 family)
MSFQIRPCIIMLHHVGNGEVFKSLEPYSITTRKFIELLDFIEYERFETITFQDYRLFNLKKKVVITFDDCSRELLVNAVPELVKRNMKAVFFIPTNFIGGKNDWDITEGKEELQFFSEEDIKYLSSFENFEIGSHSHFHKKMDELTEKEIQFEFSHSKKIIERITEKSVISFAYPFGRFSNSSQKIIKEMNYRFGLGIYVPYENKRLLRRFIYHNNDTYNTLRKKTSFIYSVFRMLRDKVNS